jgi:agmatine/peptidylarginine deiminase
MTFGAEKGKNRWRLPAEWEPQEGVQLTWPHAATDWAPMLEEIIAVYQEMAREIAKHERLVLVVGDIPTNDTWARDHGFISLVDDQGHRRLLDYQFNGWGQKFAANLDNLINRKAFNELKHLLNDQATYVGPIRMVLEGGSVESDGEVVATLIEMPYLPVNIKREFFSYAYRF